MHTPNILIIDDDSSIRLYFESVLKDEFNVITTESAETGLALIRKNQVDIVLLDVMLGSCNGIDILKQIKKEVPNTEVIVISVLKDIRTAVEAMREGAYDYINKDVDLAELKTLIAKAAEKKNLTQTFQSLKEEVSSLTTSNFVEGTSPRITEIIQLIKRIGPLSSNVLILGESSTGKEFIARRIHELYSSHLGCVTPFISINMAGIPDELL